MFKNNYPVKDENTKTKISQKKYVWSITYDVLNQHDTISRGSATGKKQQQKSASASVSARACVFLFDVLVRRRPNYLSFILFSLFSFCDFSFITAYRALMEHPNILSVCKISDQIQFWKPNTQIWTWNYDDISFNFFPLSFCFVWCCVCHCSVFIHLLWLNSVKKIWTLKFCCFHWLTNQSKRKMCINVHTHAHTHTLEPKNLHKFQIIWQWVFMCNKKPSVTISLFKCVGFRRFA